MDQTMCTAVLGPTTDYASRCQINYLSGTGALVYTHYNPEWTRGGSGGGLFQGHGTIDAVGNSFVSTWSLSTPYVLHVYDAAGVELPSDTVEAPTEPDQALPPGFDAVLLQLQAPHTHVDWLGEISVAGVAIAAVDMGGGVLAKLGSSDVIAARYASDGQYLWSRRFYADGATAELVSNAFGPSNGSIVVSGSYAQANFGHGSLPPNDSYFVMLQPGGAVSCAQDTNATAFAAGPAGEVYAISSGAPLQIGDTVYPASLPFTGCSMPGDLVSGGEIAAIAP